jgi:Uma2 family endonuclease
LDSETHSAIQGNLIYYFRLHRDEWGVRAFPEQRVQVSPTRFRVPDVTIVKLSQEQGEIFTNPPHLCIEILSRDDTMEDVLEKIDDYLNYSIPCVWIIHAWSRRGYVVTTEGMFEAKSGILETKDPAISMPLTALFE